MTITVTSGDKIGLQLNEVSPSRKDLQKSFANVINTAGNFNFSDGSDAETAVYNAAVALNDLTRNTFVDAKIVASVSMEDE